MVSTLLNLDDLKSKTREERQQALMEKLDEIVLAGKQFKIILITGMLVKYWISESHDKHFLQDKIWSKYQNLLKVFSMIIFIYLRMLMSLL